MAISKYKKLSHVIYYHVYHNNNHNQNIDIRKYVKYQEEQEKQIEVEQMRFEF